MNRRVGLAALLVAMVAFSGIALAEKEEMILRDGTSGFVEVLETKANGVKIKFKKDGSDISLFLKANQIDPHTFYSIRKKHMERTAANHFALAVYCAENGMYNRARHQVDVARSIDPEYVEKQKTSTKVREGVGEKIVARAEMLFNAGKLEEAEEEVQIVLTHLADTAAADDARALLNVIDRAEADREAEEDAEAIAKLDAEKQKQADALMKKLKPAKMAYEYGKELAARGLREKNQTRAKKAFDEAGDQLVKALRKARDIVTKEKDFEDVAGRWAAAEKRIMAEAVEAYVNAGRIALARSSFPEAGKYAQKALQVDPTSAEAKEFENRVETGAAMNSDWGLRGINRAAGRGPR
jgi:tetratricopeptide (TPR) repeat protein